ncbi:LysE family transporter [Cryobacterium sp. 1639]|uniref:LysE family transporter n=1 Tax=Cryobacterium inferilacus TaxID=2866629 RepID=UPI001C72DB55|nr:LysE family transporter [Cryobacterium sp. 1639]MBX0299348.1 LysE family transporter [Cryobacterium sp. 1639]
MDVTVGPLFLGGVLAGWAVALPLGAIGLLLVRAALTGGFRAGAVAALAVALVDGLYCLAAVALGAVVAPLVTSWGALPGVAAGLVLIGLGGFELMRPGAAGVRPGDPAGQPSPGRIFVTFVGLTAINPATLLYFAALTAALPRSLGLDRAPAVFIAGVVAASLTWQLILAALGAVGRGRIGARGRAVLSGCGSGLVVALGVAAVVAALAAAAASA